MDPFSLAVGITGLIGLTGQTIKVTKGYLHSVKHAKETVAEMLQELEILHFNLSRLDKLLKTKEAARHFDQTSVLVSSTHACRTKLTAICQKLDGAGQGLLNQLKWPLSKHDHQESLEQLRAFSQWIQFSLTVDGCALLSKSSAEVLAILTKQLDSFGDIDRRTRSIEQSLTDQAQTLGDHRAVKEREKVLNWLSAIKHEQKHNDIRMPRMSGTGEWLLNEARFRSWRERDDSKSRDNVLWCHGIQGSGKSVLASLVVDRLRDALPTQNVVVAHFYFDYRIQGYQSTENVLASLLKQLVIPIPKLPEPVLQLHKRLSNQEKRPQQLDLEQAIFSTCKNYDRVFIVIDALDECDANNHRKAFLKALKTLRTHSNFSIFVTSRPYPEDIKEDLKATPQIIIGAHDDDLERYISGEIESSDNIDEIDAGFKIEITTRVRQAAQNMFLLAVLQIQTILAEPTAGDMEEALKNMPRGLNDAFEETLQRIHKLPEGRRRLGLNTLMWMSHVHKPLTVDELSDALAIRLGEASLNTKYRPSQKRMVDCCLGLVTVDEETSIIRLVHYTAQEYLQEHLDQTFDLAGQTTAELIAELSLTYLMTEPFAAGCCPDEVSIWSIVSRYRFIKYASQFWGNHVLNANSERINKLALNYLQARPQLAMSFQICRYTLGYREVYWEPLEARSANGLHVAAYFGLEDVAKQILDANALDVDSATSMGTTALILASARGHSPILNVLLKKGADTRKENWYGTALHCSAESGKVSSIIELLETGIDVNIRSHGRTALDCAVQKRHVDAMLELVKRGAERS